MHGAAVFGALEIVVALAAAVLSVDAPEGPEHAVSATATTKAMTNEITRGNVIQPARGGPSRLALLGCRGRAVTLTSPCWHGDLREATSAPYVA